MTGSLKTLGYLFDEARKSPHLGLAVNGLVTDSRKAEPGTVFVAVPGAAIDGSRFIGAAIDAGAIAVVGEIERPADLRADVAYVRVANVRRALALAAARLFGRQPKTTVAVTGTSGKSSVAEFVRQIEAGLGYESASLGTIGVVTSSGSAYGSLTTPDPISLHRTLAQLADDGVTHLAMEASSHGIEQHRLDGVQLKAAGFTNIGRDHLDYHLTVEAYIAAKLRLFEELLPGDGHAVVNADGASADRFMDAAAKRGLPLLTTGRTGRTIRLVDAVADGFSQILTVEIDGKTVKTRLPLLGAFQVENALLAAGLALAAENGARGEEIVSLLGGLHGVKGRMERVEEINGALCIVDYAHKPDALQHVLDALRPFTPGRLICVFGCGGDRDKGKRPIMGRIAAEKADVVIVTDDNPRSENPAVIRAEILQGAPGAKEIGDRAEAIRIAIKDLMPGDVLVVAGKGHEMGQIVGNRTLPFSDHEEIAKAAAEVRG